MVCKAKNSQTLQNIHLSMFQVRDVDPNTNLIMQSEASKIFHKWTECILTEKYVCRSQQQVPLNSSLAYETCNESLNNWEHKLNFLEHLPAQDPRVELSPANVIPHMPLLDVNVDPPSVMQIQLACNLTYLRVDENVCVLRVTLAMQSWETEWWRLILGFQQLGLPLRCHVQSTPPF